MAEPTIAGGRSWTLDAPIVACAFDRDGIGAFACGDGTLRFFADEKEPDTTRVHAGAVLSLIPILVIFALLQRFMKPEMFGGAVKG